MESPLRSGVPAGTRLIETFGWHPDTGFRHLDRHLSRMARSAHALGFDFAQDAALSAIRVAGNAGLRCRLTLGQDGFDFTSAPLGSTPKQWAVQISNKRLDANDIWLRHKTTQRALYDAERAALPKGTDEWLFANQDGEFCEGTITNLFVTRPDGQMITPPITAGVLPGILRGMLLDQGRVIESPVTLQDLQSASAIHMGNSLRGLIKADLISP
ncbi:aminotransferase class IV family protein [Cognatishimia sp. WU-CL00825]|uniref:aminotransferase class IV family protein n=1 Tax=Cognatishimia sp. WU-CL00825 TaxID=3127658 RepID=UPI0031059BFE